MSYNSFYTNRHGSNVTFHDFRYPPPPPTIHIVKDIPDEEFVKQFESKIQAPKAKIKLSATTLFQIKDELASLVSQLNDIQEEEKKLSQSVSELSEDEWQSVFNRIVIKKNEIRSQVTALYNSQLDLGKRLIAKRLAKRLRLKRLKEERKKERQEKNKERAEKSRKIDENLQKIQDDIQKAKQAKEDHLQADIVLRETLRKILDAKKSIVKLEALVKLRKARQNTAKGMGKTVNEAEKTHFLESINKLKNLWESKLAIYLLEEENLRKKLEKRSKQNTSPTKRDITNNLIKWKEVMFGADGNPQVDFGGDLEQFIAVRCSWDRYIADGPESSSLPIGWLTPITPTLD